MASVLQICRLKLFYACLLSSIRSVLSLNKGVETNVMFKNARNRYSSQFFVT